MQVYDTFTAACGEAGHCQSGAAGRIRAGNISVGFARLDTPSPHIAQERSDVVNCLSDVKGAGIKQLNILLLGKSSVGKSSTVNSFLGEAVARVQAFKLQADGEMVSPFVKQVGQQLCAYPSASAGTRLAGTQALATEGGYQMPGPSFAPVSVFLHVCTCMLTCTHVLAAAAGMRTHTHHLKSLIVPTHPNHAHMYTYICVMQHSFLCGWWAWWWRRWHLGQAWRRWRG